VGKRAKKVRVLKVKKVAPDVCQLELEIIDGPEPPKVEPPSDPIDMLGHSELPDAHKSWWTWLKNQW
jgi:hypothetical protein